MNLKVISNLHESMFMMLEQTTNRQTLSRLEALDVQLSAVVVEISIELEMLRRDDDTIRRKSQRKFDEMWRLQWENFASSKCKPIESCAFAHLDRLFIFSREIARLCRLF